MKEINLSINGNGKSPKKSSKSKKRIFGFGRRGNSRKPKKVLSPKEKKQRKKKRLKRLGIIVLIFLTLGGGIAVAAYKWLANMGVDASTFISGQLSPKKDPQLLKDENDFTNVLMVGIDTRENDKGLQNTDTIMVASLNHSTDEVSMISIPRDTYVSHPDNDSYYTKINAIYNSCEQVEEGTGMDCLIRKVQTITSLEIQYYGMIDVAGLIHIVDTIGGVDVDVERAFTDYMFPTPNGGYEVVSFEAGPQHMDGETAMKYARSRHAQSVEGSDYARARRQQKIIAAVKEKAMSSETYSNPMKFFSVLSDLGDSVKVGKITTDGHEKISNEDIQAGINAARKVDQDDFYSMVLDPMAGNWTLMAETGVLIPKAGYEQWGQVHVFIQSFVTYPALYSENANIYVYNGGLGYNETFQKTQELTESLPFVNITFGGNLWSLNHTGTTIVSTADETKFATLEELSEIYGTEWTDTPPEGVSAVYGEDIVIVMGAPAPPPAAEPAETTQTPAQ